MSLYGNLLTKEWSTNQRVVDSVDDRLTEFLGSFTRKGRFSIEFGFFICTTEWNPRRKKHTIVNTGDYCTLTIQDGIVLNREKIPNVLRILDAAGIMTPLPVFKGEEMILYTPRGKDWIEFEDLGRDDTFYMTYYSID